MSDLERQLEELFMSDSRSRRVDQVNVPAPRRSRFGGLAFVGGVALTALALIVAFSLVRGGADNVPASSPTPSGSAGVVASLNPSASGVPGEQVMCGQVSLFKAPTSTVSGSFVITPSGATGNYIVIPAGGPLSAASGYTCVKVKNLPQGAPSVVFVAALTPGMEGYVAEGAAGSTPPSGTGGPSAVRPDAQHGVIARGSGEGESVMRTESDAAILSRFPRQLSAATTRDGLRVAYFRTAQTGQQLVIFDTAKPSVEKTLVDLSGSGEVAGEVVWSSELSNDLLFSVHKIGPGVGSPVTYSTLRVVDAATGAVREIARITSGLYLRPLIWHGASPSTAAALEWSGAGGFAANYDYIRDGTLTRSPFEPQVVASSVRADVDGQRVLAIGGLPAPRGVTWWQIDRFDARDQLKPTEGSDISVALWRYGTDEIVVFASGTTKGGPGAAQRLEAWDIVSGRRRTVAENVGPLGILRVDGSAAITTSWMLVDLRTGGATEIPGADRNQVPYLAVKF